MQIDDDLAQRLGASVVALNARIARLAMALDIDLNDRPAVDALMSVQQLQPVAVERRTTSGNVAHVPVTSDRRLARQREELRGLLVLRYHLETTSLNDNGLAVTREVMEQAEAHLVRQGFKPGADGLALDHIFSNA